ncbi:iron-siderophore ABC transporter permease protein [Bacillus sp. TS-2]|nr:iron-siderophore ABC transporter permease protein [Bacillus sp. TS-2]
MDYKEVNRKTRIPFLLKIMMLLILFVASFFAAFYFGAANVTWTNVWHAIFSTDKNEEITLLQELRYPRVIAAIFIGAALAVSGSIMQGLTRNPLADPGLIGLSAGANLALAVAIVWFPSLNYFGIMIACFIGATIGAFLVFGIGASKRGGFTPFRLVLAGAAISAFLLAISEGIGLYFKVSKEVSMWTAGGLIGTTWGQLKWLIPVIVITLIVAMILSRQLSILSLSDEVAVGLGQSTFLMKGILFLLTVILAGAAVSLAGNIVFIGLMIPHIVRSIVGHDYRLIIPASIVVGASFMMIADTVGRTINAPYETPVSAIVAMLGLPFFLYIVRKGGGIANDS